MFFRSKSINSLSSQFTESVRRWDKCYWWRLSMFIAIDLLIDELNVAFTNPISSRHTKYWRKKLLNGWIHDVVDFFFHLSCCVFCVLVAFCRLHCTPIVRWNDKMAPKISHLSSLPLKLKMFLLSKTNANINVKYKTGVEIIDILLLNVYKIPINNMPLGFFFLLLLLIILHDVAFKWFDHFSPCSRITDD